MIRGRVLKYEADDVNTDVIWPGKYTYVQLPPEAMPQHAMETFDPEFPRKVAGCEALVVGRNFGCGSSREQASECLKYSGIEVVIARSFARIFYRNSINIGLAVIESPELVDALETGDEVAVDLAAGEVAAKGRTFSVARYPDLVLRIIQAGGLLEDIRRGDLRDDALARDGEASA